MLKKADVVREFVCTCRDPCKNIEHTRVDFAGIGLPGNGIARVKAHLLRDHRIEPVDLFPVALEEFQKAGLRAGRSFAAKQTEGTKNVVQIGEIHEELLDPECGALAEGRRLRRLEMRKSKRRLILLFPRKVREGGNHIEQMSRSASRMMIRSVLSPT